MPLTCEWGCQSCYNQAPLIPLHVSICKMSWGGSVACWNNTPPSPSRPGAFSTESEAGKLCTRSFSCVPTLDVCSEMVLHKWNELDLVPSSDWPCAMFAFISLPSWPISVCPLSSAWQAGGSSRPVHLSPVHSLAFMVLVPLNSKFFVFSEKGEKKEPSMSSMPVALGYT